MDEKNSILIDAYVLGNSLVSTFSVAGNVITSNYELDGDELLFTILMHKDKSVRFTGDTLHLGEEIPIVHSFQNTVLQKAKLKRVR